MLRNKGKQKIEEIQTDFNPSAIQGEKNYR